MESRGLYVTQVSVAFLGDGVSADEPPPPLAIARVNFEYRTKDNPPIPISTPKDLYAPAVLDMTVRELIQFMRQS